MGSNTLIGKFYTLAEWILKAMYLHLLWIIFTLAGGIVLGVMPSSTAVFSIIRKWLQGETDLKTLPFFLSVYKSSWKTTNLAGLIFLCLSTVLLVDLQLNELTIKSALIHLPLLLFGLLLSSTMILFFPVYVHYDLKIFQHIKQAFILSLAQPLCVMAILLWIVTAYILSLYIPIIFLFMGISVVTLPIMWFSLHSFNKLEAKSMN
ncbi:DUF624 domain-containing protein [Bacillus sp. CMF21]|nr:DUF624 domain-containing protein [Bacillus sp. CMF21]